MSNHTPGPWQVVHPSNGIILIVSPHIPAVDVPIARMIRDEREGVDPHDNARLIAAAPEMLDVLKMTLSILDNVGPDEYPNTCAIIRQAIEKAEGV